MHKENIPSRLLAIGMGRHNVAGWSWHQPFWIPNPLQLGHRPSRTGQDLSLWEVWNLHTVQISVGNHTGPPPFRTKEQAIAVYTQACRLESQGRSARAREYCMRKGYINNSKQTAPLPPLVKSTWAFRFFSAYSCCPPEIMHDFSGLAKMSFR